MELKTIRQVSLDYGISRQMLCYYEQIGLLKSNRKEDYAYRVYDEDAIKRLQQIVILRKLQIPMKHIKSILGNQDAVTVIEIFKQNIGELDEEITALSTLRTILARFVDELQEKADVYLKLDLLNDKTMINLVDSLSFAKHKIKEKVSMEELNKASETLDKLADNKARVVYLPPMTIAFTTGTDCRTALKKFIDDVDLFNIKPDARVFGTNADGFGVGVGDIFVSIPDDLQVPAPFKRCLLYKGGNAFQESNEKLSGQMQGILYAASIEGQDLWIEKSDEYEWAPQNGPGMWEMVNPFNQYGLKNSNSEETGFMYADVLIPIRETEKPTDEQKKMMNMAINNLEYSFSQNEIAEIDLTTMVKRGNVECHYQNGLMTIKVSDDNFNDDGMVTPQSFKLPLKITLRAKTDGKDLRIRYANGKRIFNWWHTRSTLVTSDIVDGSFNMQAKCGEIPVDEFVDIEWIFGRNESVIKVNGEIRHSENDCGYIRAFKENSDFILSSPITITAAKDSTVTVESLRVTEF